jgi:catechol 2,3-dioxygenase-like lactoylglutathione lyase family enzyme
MIDHVSLGVSDLGRAGAFYDAVLAPLGYVRLFANRGIGYGVAGAKDEAFAILAEGERAKAPGAGCHLAFAAPSRGAVDAFHAAALAMGATDEGAPGPRPHYGAGYYAAFVRDLDGHRLEAVCHER